MNDYPTVQARRVHGCHDGGRDLIVVCPHCERLHTHGWPYGSGEPGSRVAHCLRVRDEVTGRWRDRRPGDEIGGYRIIIGASTVHTGLQAVAS